MERTDSDPITITAVWQTLFEAIPDSQILVLKKAADLKEVNFYDNVSKIHTGLTAYGITVLHLATTLISPTPFSVRSIYILLTNKRLVTRQMYKEG